MYMVARVIENDPAKWSKLEKIRFLLDHWHDIFDAGLTRNMEGSRSTPSSRAPGHMTPMARHSSVAELENCLRTLHDTEPELFKHLKAYRCNVEWRNVDAHVRVRLPSGKWDTIETRSRSRLVPRWVDVELNKLGEVVGGKVYRAELHLVMLFRGEVFIPDALWKGLTAPAA